MSEDLFPTVQGDDASAAEEAPAKPRTLYELLRARYAAPEWVLMQEVAPKTGGGTRYADGVAINLWSSRGHTVEGFEVKVSRSDWLRELKQPEKAEPVMRYCDRWWLVTERDVVKPGELPVNWGHLQRRGNGLAIVTAAPKLEPQPMTRAFFASLVRRAFELIDERGAQAWADERTRLVNEWRAERDRLAAELRKRPTGDPELAARVAEFAEATGVDLASHWSAKPAIQTFKLAQRLWMLQTHHSASGQFDKLDALADQLDSYAAALRKALADTGMGPTEPAPHVAPTVPRETPEVSSHD